MTLLANLICIELFIIQGVYSQCVNRIVQGPNGPIELLPNQVLIPPGVPYLGPVLPGTQGRSVIIPGPNPPCKPTQPVVVPTPAPLPEYNMALSPVIANIAPPNVPAGNVIVPNIQSAMPNVLSGNVFVPNYPAGNFIVPSGNLVVPNAPSGNMVVPSGVLPITEAYGPTVIHDNSVANSLANALQLLVVSNLLGSTLPDPFDPPCYNGYIPGYSYIY